MADANLAEQLRKLQEEAGLSPSLSAADELKRLREEANNKQANKIVSDFTSKPEIAQEFFTDPRTGQMTSRELMLNQSGGKNFGGLLGNVLNKTAQGLTFGYSDELLGLLNRANIFQGGTADQRQRFATEFARAQLEAGEKNFPKSSVASEIGGAIISPAAKLGQAKTVLNQVAKAVPLGAVASGVYASGTSEGDVSDRVEAGVEAAPYGAAFGFIAPVIGNTIGGMANKTYSTLFQKSVTKPTVTNLRQLKDFAYDKLSKSGHKFSKDEVDDLALKVMSITDDVDYLPGEKHIDAAINYFNNQTKDGGKSLTLSQVAKLRERLHSIYRKGFDGGNKYDPRIYKMIDDVDDMINSHGGASALYKGAKEAHGRYKKAQLVEDAFNRADRAAQASGSGGNVLNSYKQAVNRILNSKQARFFTKDEVKAMEAVVSGNVDQRMMRLIGKASPSGNGLMLMLNGIAAMQNPGFLALTGAGMASKLGAEKNQRQLIEELENYLATGVRPKKKLKSGRSPIGMSSAQNIFGNEEPR